ncbi:DUF1127 domain-containing protein [Phytopseudomonas daroniae]|uniref:DUF1127 domain-containing protein n=1 Tax=Phytopseudomonas daroniae TaxID=2487519 RepID=UPI001038385A|nr:DUF1127 domain-containing protein [Pseudomonas daroniae]TBU73147.1 hypothetical protein DNK10_17845 [Pseudomonas daroniae]
MSGLSDVRLTLKSSELDGCARQRVAELAPPREALTHRWKLFIRRLMTRGALRELSDAQLHDIGLTRDQARQEASLPFWKL